jgi:hypothetical protein
MLGAKQSVVVALEAKYPSSLIMVKERFYLIKAAGSLSIVPRKPGV